MSEIKNGRYVEYGSVFYYLNDELHREDGPAVINSKENRRLYVNDVRNRDDNYVFPDPVDGEKSWFLNDKLHREDGPAYEGSYINIPDKWYLNGVQYTEEEFNQWLVKKNLNEKLHENLSHKAKIKRSKI